MTRKIIATAVVVAICAVSIAQANLGGGTKYAGSGTDDPDMFVKLIKFPKKQGKPAFLSVFKARKIDYVCTATTGQTTTAQEKVTFFEVPVRHQSFSVQESGWDVEGHFGRDGTVSGTVSRTVRDTCVADEAWTATEK